MGLGVTVMACLWGGAIAGFGYMTSLVPALVLLAVAGGADFYSAVLRSTMLLRSTPDHLRGRLLGIEFMQVASAPSLGDLEAVCSHRSLHCASRSSPAASSASSAAS